MNDLSSSHFLQLITRAQYGDQEAYHEALNIIYPWVENKASRKVFNPHDVGDVVQEVMLSVHRYLNTFDSSYPFTPWLSAICQRRIIDYIRRNARKQKIEENDDQYVTNHIGAANIESKIEKFELLNELPKNLIQPIWLTKIMGHTTEDAAKLLDIKENALRTRLSRAFKIIEANLKKEL